MNIEEVEEYELFKNKYLQQPISLLTKHNLELLEEHCKKQLYHETGQRIREHETVLELIYRYKQLENKVKEQDREKQELIKMLEEDNEQDTESVKRYEEMRRNCEDSFYKKLYQTSIHKLNAKREVRESILSKLKGEEGWKKI